MSTFPDPATLYPSISWPEANYGFGVRASRPPVSTLELRLWTTTKRQHKLGWTIWVPQRLVLRAWECSILEAWLQS